MKKTNQVFTLLVAVIITYSMSSCSSGGSERIVEDIEACLDGVKNQEDMRKLSKSEAVEIAQCILPYMQSVNEKLDELNSEEAEEFGKDLEAAINKSKLKTIIRELDYPALKELAESSSYDESEKFYTDSDSEDWDAVLHSYENYIDQYIKLMKKAKNGDASVSSEYIEMMEKATDLAEKMERAEDELSTSQLAKFTKLQTRLAKAAMEP